MLLNSTPYYNTHNETQSFKKFLTAAVLVHVLGFISSSTIFSKFNFSTINPLAFEATQTIDLNLSSLKQTDFLKQKKQAVAQKKVKEPLITDKIEKDKLKENTATKANNSSSTSKAQPFAKNKIHAAYPPLAEEMQIEGTVFMKFLVNEFGKILDVKVTKSSGSKILDDAAIKALKTAKNFSPATDKSGKAVESWGEYSINFSLTEDS